MPGDERASVFLNCPFDSDYRPLFDAIVFSVLAYGFRIRSALEVDDSGELRLEKIYRLIAECDLSIHDISRTELDADSALPRFNMPIELGICLGFRRYSSRAVKHRILVIDRERFRYQKFASDLAGMDIKEHGSRPNAAIKAARDFLSSTSSGLPTVGHLEGLLETFERSLPAMAAALSQSVDELTYPDRVRHIEFFLAQAGS